jgi:hypothetical protein
MKKGLSLVCLLGILVFPVWAEPDLAKLSREAYNRKDYRNAARLSLQYLQSQEQIDVQDPVLEIFFKTEGDLARLDYFLERAYPQSRGKSVQVYNLMSLFLEKCYHAKESRIGFRWGDTFMEEGGSSSGYAKGLFAYSGMLYLEKEGRKARRILKDSSLAHSKGVLKKRKSLLAMALYKREKKVIKTANQFLVHNSGKPYADFVIALIVESYQKLGDSKKAKEWQHRLEKEYPNSAFKNI